MKLYIILESWNGDSWGANITSCNTIEEVNKCLEDEYYLFEPKDTSIPIFNPGKVNSWEWENEEGLSFRIDIYEFDTK